LAITLRREALGAVPAFSVTMMKTLARRGNGNRNAADEVQKLQEVLDKSYAQMRERACMEWQDRCAGGDPSDACVQVRIGCRWQRAIEV
jgi:hypothetical protein